MKFCRDRRLFLAQQFSERAGTAASCQNGIDIVSREMVLFEWLDRSGSELFDELWERRLR